MVILNVRCGFQETGIFPGLKQLWYFELLDGFWSVNGISFWPVQMCKLMNLWLAGISWSLNQWTLNLRASSLKYMNKYHEPNGRKVKNSQWLSVESADWHPVNRLVIWSGNLSETMRHCQCRCLCILKAQGWVGTVAGEFQKRTFTCDLKSAISSFCFWI